MDIYQAMLNMPHENTDQLHEEMMRLFPDLALEKPFESIDRIDYALAAVSLELVEWNATNAKLVMDAAGTILSLFLKSGMSLESFIKTKVGYITNQGWLWACQDAMVSISEASEITSLSELTILYLVKHENLISFSDPFEPDPQKAIRVIRSKVIQLADELNRRMNI